MYGKMKEHLSNTLAEIKEAGLYKEERLIESAQQAAITVKGKEVLNFCANNYLGLSNHPRLIAAAQKMMDHRGYGMSSVRFICVSSMAPSRSDALIPIPGSIPKILDRPPILRICFMLSR